MLTHTYSIAIYRIWKASASSQHFEFRMIFTSLPQIEVVDSILFRHAQYDQKLKALALLECICKRRDANILPQKELGMRPAGCGAVTVMLLDVYFETYLEDQT